MWWNTKCLTPSQSPWGKYYNNILMKQFSTIYRTHIHHSQGYNFLCRKVSYSQHIYFFLQLFSYRKRHKVVYCYEMFSTKIKVSIGLLNLFHTCCLAFSILPNILNYCVIIWHRHWHTNILTSKEQSWLIPDTLSSGHWPGQSSCLPRLQKKVKCTR